MEKGISVKAHVSESTRKARDGSVNSTIARKARDGSVNSTIARKIFLNSANSNSAFMQKK